MKKAERVLAHSTAERKALLLHLPPFNRSTFIQEPGPPHDKDNFPFELCQAVYSLLLKHLISTEWRRHRIAIYLAPSVHCRAIWFGLEKGCH